jgi:hypothetical protein
MSRSGLFLVVLNGQNVLTGPIGVFTVGFEIRTVAAKAFAVT